MTLLGFLPALLILLTVVHMASPDKPSEKVVGRTVYYSGRVQGIGFRATVVDIARHYPVTGWVKNLDDDRVQLLVEGSEDEVKKFLAAVRTRWQKNIDKEQVEERKPTGEYRTFSIQY